MSFADIKAQARRDVHASLAVPVTYTAPGEIDAVPGLTARLHDRRVVGGDVGGAGYAEIIEGVTRAIFNREQLATLTITLEQRGVIEFPDYGRSFSLDVRDPYNGPIDEIWSIVPE